ncbi:MAG TPA: hypothetical protein PK466_11510 [Thermotogota bacterium]|nr:hypothetical protein [Thermotogota bacterium]HPJ90014.1 hypothetical protein [Thermotogota bacterium]HPR96951.1 hypothetical protein [Thermotogota bacterium]
MKTTRNFLFVSFLVFFVVIFTAAGCPLFQYQNIGTFIEIQNETSETIRVMVLDTEKMPIGSYYEIKPGESDQIRATTDSDYISISKENGDVWHYTAGGEDLTEIIFESKVIVVNGTNGYWET